MNNSFGHPMQMPQWWQQNSPGYVAPPAPPPAGLFGGSPEDQAALFGLLGGAMGRQGTPDQWGDAFRPGASLQTGLLDMRRWQDARLNQTGNYSDGSAFSDGSERG